MTIDSATFSRFKVYCQENGMKVSSRVELLMEKNLVLEKSLQKKLFKLLEKERGGGKKE